jgi:hypothetical protein
MTSSGGCVDVVNGFRVEGGDRTGSDGVKITVGTGVIACVITAPCGVIPDKFGRITIPMMAPKITIASIAITTNFDFLGGGEGVAGGGS